MHTSHKPPLLQLEIHWGKPNSITAAGGEMTVQHTQTQRIREEISFENTSLTKSYQVKLESSNLFNWN